MMGDLSGLRFVNSAGPSDGCFNSETPMGTRDALMVRGFDLLGHNRTLQIHWLKRVIAFFLDVVTVFAPLWSFRFFENIRAQWVYGVVGGIALYGYSTLPEAGTGT